VSHRVDDKGCTSADSDVECVSLIKEGRLEAFEELVERYQKRMLNIAYRMIGDYDEACEVVQEAFLSAYRAIKKFRGDAKFSTWLTGITMNHAKNRLRQIKSRSYHEVTTFDDPVDAASSETVYDTQAQDTPALEQLERNEIRQKVWECIGTLDQDHREVLVLRDIEEFSYEEIGLILKIPDGTIKSRLSRARSALTQCLKMKKVIGDL